MAFSKPIGYMSSSAVMRGRAEKQIEKTGEIRRNFIDILEPHIRRFVELTYKENDGVPAEKVADVRRFDRQMLEGLISEHMQAEVDRLEGEEKGFFEEVLQSAKEMETLSDEELLRRMDERDEEIISEFSRGSADEIWRMTINALHRLWKQSGPQSIGIKELIAGLDFARYLADRISEEYYPEMKEIIVALAPELFKESHMDTTRRGYVEMAYLESSGQIVLREVSWEMVQTWANS